MPLHPLCSNCKSFWDRATCLNFTFTELSRPEPEGDVPSMPQHVLHSSRQHEITAAAETGCHSCSIIIGSLTGCTGSHRARKEQPTNSPIYASIALLNQEEDTFQMHFFDCEESTIVSYDQTRSDYSLCLRRLESPTSAADADTQTSTIDEPTSSRLQTWTYSEATAELIKSWIQECQSNHLTCSDDHLRLLHGSKQTPPRPRRLLDLEAFPTPDRIRLVDAENDSSIPYCALSYSWGFSKPYVLTSLNLNSFRTEIHLKDLPKTFRDAITVVRGIGSRYLWIDALCIMQDGQSSPTASADWLDQVSKMGDIFGNSFLNISASESHNGNEGFIYPRNPLSHTPCRFESALPTQSQKLRSFIIEPPCTPHCPQHPFQNAKYHLDSRAWVFQERRLSPRTVHFTRNFLHLECRTELRCETQDVVALSLYDIDNPTDTDTPHASATKGMDIVKPKSYTNTKVNVMNETMSKSTAFPKCHHSGAAIKGDYQLFSAFAPFSLDIPFLDLKMPDPNLLSSLSDPTLHPPLPGFDLSMAGLNLDLSLPALNPIPLDIPLPPQDISLNLSLEAVTPKFLSSWHGLITAYSTTSLSRPSDLLVALAGLAKPLASSFTLTWSFGLWREMLAREILWYVHSGTAVRMKTRAPSWSWAGLEVRESQKDGEGKEEREKNEEPDALARPQAEIHWDIFLAGINVVAEITQLPPITDFTRVEPLRDEDVEAGTFAIRLRGQMAFGVPSASAKKGEVSSVPRKRRGEVVPFRFCRGLRGWLGAYADCPFHADCESGVEGVGHLYSLLVAKGADLDASTKPSFGGGVAAIIAARASEGANVTGLGSGKGKVGVEGMATASDLREKKQWITELGLVLTPVPHHKRRFRRVGYFHHPLWRSLEGDEREDLPSFFGGGRSRMMELEIV